MSTDTKSSRGSLATLLVIPIVFAIVGLLAMLSGAAAGWLGEFIFPQVFERLTALAFGEAIPGWQFGAMLGFVGGFLRASIPKRR